MSIDLSPAIAAAGDFTGDGVVAWTHRGVVRVRGYLFPNGDSAQAIVGPGEIPAGMLPAGVPLSVTLSTSVALSDPKDFAAGHHYPDLDATHPSTILADGSWSLDAPLDASWSFVQLLFTAQWACAAPEADVPPGAWVSLGPLLAPAWTNIDAEYATHGDTLHLRGSVEAAADQAEFGMFIVIGEAGGLPNPVTTGGTHDYTYAEAQTDGYDVPVELEVDAGIPGTGAGMFLSGRPVPQSSLIGADFRYPGGTTSQSYPDRTPGPFNQTAYTVDLTGTDWAQDASYPHFSWDTDRVTPQWRTPWWTWTTGIGLDGFAPGPVAAIPSVPNLDLGVLIGAWAWPPDWVTIRFGCSMNLSYYGWQTLADAQADAAGDQVPNSPFAHATRSAAMAAVTPAVSGVSNRKFVDSGTYDASPGPYTGRPSGSADGFEPYNLMESFAAACYLAPASPSYAPRKIIEPAGLEHAQLLWRPTDVGTATVEMFGEAQAADLSVTWTVAPFWQLPDDYLIAGDTITFTQASWWPIAAPRGYQMLV